MDPIDPICFRCKHATLLGCAAFPDGIPEIVWESNSHNSPLEGQVDDFIFEPEEDD